MAVQFFAADRKVPVLPRKKLTAFIDKLFEKEGKKLSGLSYVFCSDDYLLNINRQFLQHDYYTDIITFDISSDKSAVEGEIYISIDRVKENAKIHQQVYSSEMLRVIFHGALHLCGYWDKSSTQIKLMRQKEDYYIQLFGGDVSHNTVSV